MFLKLEGVKGESLVAGYEGAIDVLAWSWGASNAGSVQVKSTKTLPSFQDLSLTKYVDRSSEDLLRLLSTGKEVPLAELAVLKGGGDKPFPYLIIRFKPVIVTSVSTGGSGGEDQLTENVTINFGRYEFVYTPQSASGGLGEPETFAWDIQTGAEITGSF
jgi:type VI secretion system secreted protein Hcp